MTSLLFGFISKGTGFWEGMKCHKSFFNFFHLKIMKLIIKNSTIILFFSLRTYTKGLLKAVDISSSKVETRMWLVEDQ